MWNTFSLPYLISFKHCRPESIVISLALPTACPVCGAEMRNLQNFVEDPSKILGPWIPSEMCPCTVVVRPTVGKFLLDYTGTEDLHIGISDSNGQVTHYDEGGIHQDSSWSECLPIFSLQDPSIFKTGIIPADKRCVWDNTLTVHSLSWRMDRRKYDEYSRNCFDFVVGFVCDITKTAGTEIFPDKEAFTVVAVLPRIQHVLQFLTLYKKVCESAHGWIVQKV